MNCKLLMSSFGRLSRSEINHGRAAMILIAVLIICKSLA
ncbi:hypothetical protein EV05_1917 [Prochlorococcus sp. MIT 0601]|nr:hypothetical protein EV05_1917 [Prochlorococcus sp. MIT 0601]